LAINKQKAVLVVTDGLGFSRSRSAAVIDAAWDELDIADQELIEGTAARIGRDDVWAKNILYPIHVESLAADTPTRQALTWVEDLRTCRGFLNEQLTERIDSQVESTADAHRYVPWASKARNLWAIRNENLTIPTSAAGVWVGFEDLDPAVQGNSETGHQQIGNMALAPQLPLEITNSIKTGEFFDNPELNAVIKAAKDRGAVINFCFLLSGVGGGDGRVHSAWNHLEAFLELVFTRLGVVPDHVQMQAILDGRDSAADSSIVTADGSGDFLGKLQALLGKYNAETALAWVVGRSIAMDRDYREEAARTDFELMTGKAGQSVSGFDEVRSLISETHASGKTDQDVPPISLLRTDGAVPAISARDAFVDLNFRSDRQRSKSVPSRVRAHSSKLKAHCEVEIGMAFGSITTSISTSAPSPSITRCSSLNTESRSLFKPSLTMRTFWPSGPRQSDLTNTRSLPRALSRRTWATFFGDGERIQWRA